jgi:hypothetical protein
LQKSTVMLAIRKVNYWFTFHFFTSVFRSCGECAAASAPNSKNDSRAHLIA